MRPINLHVASVVVLLAICFTIFASGYQIAVRDPQFQIASEQINSLVREKRQMESFDDNEFSSPQQQAPEESGFWDRVVSVALKLFSKFVEWLNT